MVDDDLVELTDLLLAPFAIGIVGGPIHAIEQGHLVRGMWMSPATANRVRAVCGELCVIAKRWGAWNFDNLHLQRERCAYCDWHVAIDQDTTDALLRRLNPEEATLCRAILADDEYETDHPLTIQRLAHATKHGPWDLFSEECCEGDCDHDEGQCPTTFVACKECTLTAGGWAGEWEGQPDWKCTVPYPCSVATLLTEQFLIRAADGG